MGSMSPLVPTYEVYTGNPFTVNDAYSATPPYTGYPYPNGARMQPGRAVYYTYQASSASTPYWVKLRYVRYNPTASVTFTANQLAPVYWIDINFQSVSGTSSEGAFGLNGIAGALLNTSVTAGNWCFIMVGGYCPNLISATSMAAGDLAYGNATAKTVTRVASGAAAPIQKVFYMALAAISSSVNAGLIMCEDVGPA